MKLQITISFYAKGELEKDKLMPDIHIDTVVDAFKTRKTVLQIEANSGHFSNLRVMPHYFWVPTIVKEDLPLVSIMTQMDLSKFNRLLELGERWRGGAISVAIYLHYEEIDQMNILRLKHKDVLCNVSFHMVFNEGGDMLYPVNFLRNDARENVAPRSC